MKSIFIWILISCAVLAQPRSKSFLWELNSFPKDTSFNVYLSYRISYDLLVFTKDNGTYKAGVSSFIEVYKDDEVVKRSGGEQSVETVSYSSTNSAEKYLQGLVKFELPAGNYKVLPEFELIHTDRIARLPATELELINPDSNYIFKPIPVKMRNDYSSGFELANSGGVIPFSTKSYGLLVPVKNLNKERLSFDLMKDDSVVNNLNGRKIFSGTAEIVSDSTGLLINPLPGDENHTSYYMVEGFSRKLGEGTYSLKLSEGEDTLSTEFEVRWVNKPRSLFNPEKAIEMLNLIEDDTVVRDLLNNKEENYSKALQEYWKQYDRTAASKFNEVMEEFYSRVDTANLEFKTAGADVGAETDRGKIYIKFGRPDKIERSYAENNSVIELWIYNRINRKFLFKDTTGLGDYILAE